MSLSLLIAAAALMNACLPSSEKVSSINPTPTPGSGDSGGGGSAPGGRIYVYFPGSFATVNEASGSITIPITLMEPSPATLPIKLSFRGSASYGFDYQDLPLYVSAGQTSANLNITIYNDLLHEAAAETVIIDIEENSYFTPVNSGKTFNFNILDND